MAPPVPSAAIASIRARASGSAANTQPGASSAVIARMADSAVSPAASPSANSTSIRAGAARVARDSIAAAAWPAAAPPSSIAASTDSARASASSPVIASRSAAGARAMSRVKPGTRAAATTSTPNRRPGAARVSHEVPSASTGMRRRARAMSRQGCSSGGPARPCIRASNHAIAPAMRGAAASIRTRCSAWAARASRKLTMPAPDAAAASTTASGRAGPGRHAWAGPVARWRPGWQPVAAGRAGAVRV